MRAPGAIFCGECGTQRETQGLDQPTIFSQSYPPKSDPDTLANTMNEKYISQRYVESNQTPPYNQYTFPSGPHPGQIYMPGPFETKKNASRRTVLIGLLGVTGLAATGGVIGWLLHSSEQNQNHQNQKQKDTPIPLGSIHSIYKGHLSSVGTVAWAPNGKRIASGSHNAQIWNPSNGEYILSYRQHHGDVQSLTWSPDGIYIASGSRDQSVQVWQAT